MGWDLKQWGEHFGEGNANFDVNKWMKDYGTYYQPYDTTKAEFREEEFGQQRGAMGQQYRAGVDKDEQKASGGLSFSGIGQYRMSSMRDAYKSSVEGALSSRDRDIYGYEKDWLNEMYDTSLRGNEIGWFDKDKYAAPLSPDEIAEQNNNNWDNGIIPGDKHYDDYDQEWIWTGSEWIINPNASPDGRPDGGRG